jgi:predicted DsbA family dithiol-disulfide isomerase
VPPAGLPLSSLGYEPAELNARIEHLRRQAAAEGIDFAPRSPSSLLVNTHRALAAGVWAQTEAPERFDAFHHAIFSANFAENRNIGDAALEAGAGEADLREAAAAARRGNITAVPAFVFGGSRVIVGAHPAAALVQAAEQAAAGE